jgi:hypothetical protein
MPGLAGPLTSFWPWRSTEAPDQSGPVPMVHTGTRQCGDHIHVRLIDLGICVRHARYAYNHAKIARNEVVAPECGR